MNGFPVHVAHRGREAVTFSARRQDVADAPEETIPSESFEADYLLVTAPRPICNKSDGEQSPS